MENNNNQRFEIIPALLKELEQETAITRKFLALVPDDKGDWQPHPKSMKMRPLVIHIAELPAWIDMVLHTDGLDFATMPYQPTEAADNAALLQLLEDSYTKGKAALSAANESDLLHKWILRNGDTVLADYTKYEGIHVALQQTTHHRAQLGVYLRLLNIPIPGSYGPSADELGF